MDRSKVTNPYFPGQEHYFSLPPREAALAAFAIYTMANHHAEDWEYRFGDKLSELPDGSFLCESWRAQRI